MKKILLAIGASLFLGGCVVSPYDDYSYREPVRYEPCCYNSSTVIIRGGSYGYGHRPYGGYNRPYGNYRPQPSHGNNWGGHNNGGYNGGGHGNGGPRPGNHR